MWTPSRDPGGAGWRGWPPRGTRASSLGRSSAASPHASWSLERRRDPRGASTSARAGAEDRVDRPHAPCVTLSHCARHAQHQQFFSQDFLRDRELSRSRRFSVSRTVFFGVHFQTLVLGGSRAQGQGGLESGPSEGGPSRFRAARRSRSRRPTTRLAPFARGLGPR